MRETVFLAQNKKNRSVVIQCLQLGYTIVLTLIAGLGLGYLLDKQLETAPVFLIIGLLIGVVLVFLYLYNMTKE